MQSHFRNFLANDSGATAIEYVLLATLIGLALIPATFYLGSALSAKMKLMADKINNLGEPQYLYFPYKGP